MNKNDILARLMNGESAEDIAKVFQVFRRKYEIPIIELVPSKILLDYLT